MEEWRSGGVEKSGRKDRLFHSSTHSYSVVKHSNSTLLVGRERGRLPAQRLVLEAGAREGRGQGDVCCEVLASEGGEGQ